MRVEKGETQLSEKTRISTEKAWDWKNALGRCGRQHFVDSRSLQSYQLKGKLDILPAYLYADAPLKAFSPTAIGICMEWVNPNLGAEGLRKGQYLAQLSMGLLAGIWSVLES